MNVMRLFTCMSNTQKLGFKLDCSTIFQKYYSGSRQHFVVLCQIEVHMYLIESAHDSFSLTDDIVHHFSNHHFAYFSLSLHFAYSCQVQDVTCPPFCTQKICSIFPEHRQLVGYTWRQLALKLSHAKEIHLSSFLYLEDLFYISGAPPACRIHLAVVSPETIPCKRDGASKWGLYN